MSLHRHCFSLDFIFRVRVSVLSLCFILRTIHACLTWLTWLTFRMRRTQSLRSFISIKFHAWV